MEFDEKSPLPFLFNGLKHHLQVISSFIKLCKCEMVPLREMNPNLRKIGGCMIDVYHGKLSKQEIFDEIQNILTAENQYAYDQYKSYLSGAQKQYARIHIKDGSSWTLLMGRDKVRYLHIHPSRGSKFVMRTKALTLKTAIILLVYFDQKLQKNVLVEMVNEARLNYLAESPIKDDQDTIRLQRLLQLFEKC